MAWVTADWDRWRSAEAREMLWDCATAAKVRSCRRLGTKSYMVSLRIERSQRLSPRFEPSLADRKAYSIPVRWVQIGPAKREGRHNRVRMGQQRASQRSRARSALDAAKVIKSRSSPEASERF